MLGWLFASDACPVDPAAKAWIEERLIWLREEFGADDLYGGPTVVPTREFFPDPYDGTRKSARVLFDRVCDLMGADPTEIRLKFLKPAKNPLFLVNDAGDAVPTEAAGLYEPGVISINDSELVTFEHLVGTMAHELAHQRLLGEGRLDGSVFDNELLTDLTVVFKGLGIFLANSPRNWDGQNQKWPGTNLIRPEYMSPPMFGYALGLISWIRGETSPAWQKHLRYAIRGEVQQSIRFLLKTRDAKLRPITKRK